MGYPQKNDGEIIHSKIDFLNMDRLLYVMLLMGCGGFLKL